MAREFGRDVVDGGPIECPGRRLLVLVSMSLPIRTTYDVNATISCPCWASAIATGPADEVLDPAMRQSEAGERQNYVPARGSISVNASARSSLAGRGENR